MKVSLVVLTPGKTEGKIIPISISPFVIGRDPQCHLRPASPLVSKKHCSLTIREGKLVARDFNSTNGTFVNEQQIKGEMELLHQDRLRVGSLLFGVKLETGVGVDQPTPLPPTKAPVFSADDEAAAAALLSGAEDTSAGSVDEQGVPTGDTMMEQLPTGQSPSPEPVGAKAEAGKAGSKPGLPKPSGDTSSAAKAILDKYLRRPRQ